MHTHPHILSLQQAQLHTLLKTQGFPAFRANQLHNWVYDKGICDPAAMTTLSKADRTRLGELISFAMPQITTCQTAADGVIKWLLRLHDGHEVEMVFIPEETRGTLCVSSQVGCTLTCRFCHTGTQGLSRNLEAYEIVAQVYIARQHLGDFARDNAARKLSNLVFMGMGEPFYNYDNVRDAVHILMNDMGYGSRKITVSTSGVAPRITQMSADLGVQLAVSLHAPNDELRTRIMPINNKYPLKELMAAVRSFDLKAYRRITWEYVMLDGINDSPQTAKELVQLIRGIPSLVNIIPFNPWPGSPFKCSPKARITAFADVLTKAGVETTVRKTRGEDILAACGQLRSETSKFNTVSLEYPSVVARYGNEKQKVKVNIQPES